MFSLQWNIEQIVTPLLVSVFSTIICEVFVLIVEHIKKPHFFIDIRDFG